MSLTITITISSSSSTLRSRSLITAFCESRRTWSTTGDVSDGVPE